MCSCDDNICYRVPIVTIRKIVPLSPVSSGAEMKQFVAVIDVLIELLSTLSASDSACPHTPGHPIPTL